MLSRFALISMFFLFTAIPGKATTNKKEHTDLDLAFPYPLEYGSTGEGSEFPCGQYWFDTGRVNTSLWNFSSITPGVTWEKLSAQHTLWPTCNSSEGSFHGCEKGITEFLENFTLDVEEQQGTEVSKYEYGVCADYEESSSSLRVESFRGSLFLVSGPLSFSILLMFTVCGIYSSVKILRSNNIKSKLFKKNGGLLLEQHIAFNGPGAGGAKIFTVVELEMATDYYCTKKNHNFSQGPVYSKLPATGSSVMEMVFVKEKVLVEEGLVERFINEIITVAQMNHQNVIKLFGCCLETEVPILVYEFASYGTLFDYIHYRENAETAMPHWDILMEIAAESAAGLAYMHSLSIIHGNVTSSNILLTDCLAKVAGFRPPRLIPGNESQTSTLFQRTLGYLDPEYLLTGQLTEKSDVYSFGVVLVEILTGEKPIDYDRPESKRIITSHFLLSMESQDGLLQILAPQVMEENREQVTAVAELAKRCLKLSSAERPTMEEVAGKLKTLSDTYITVHVS